MNSRINEVPVLSFIETPDYILAVSDGEIKEGDICLHPNKTTIGKIQIALAIAIFKETKEGCYVEDCKKIIAYQPKGNAPELDLPLLPELVVEDDVEKLAEECFEYLKITNPKGGIKEFIRLAVNFAYNKGKAATKVYSEEEVLGAIEIGFELGRNFDDDNPNVGLNWLVHQKDSYIQSIKQPKPKWFVAEMETYDEGGFSPERKLKTTTINSKTYLVGNYKYE